MLRSRRLVSLTTVLAVAFGVLTPIVAATPAAAATSFYVGEWDTDSTTREWTDDAVQVISAYVMQGAGGSTAAADRNNIDVCLKRRPIIWDNTINAPVALGSYEQLAYASGGAVCARTKNRDDGYTTTAGYVRLHDGNNDSFYDPFTRSTKGFNNFNLLPGDYEECLVIPSYSSGCAPSGQTWNINRVWNHPLITVRDHDLEITATVQEPFNDATKAYLSPFTTNKVTVTRRNLTQGDWSDSGGQVGSGSDGSVSWYAKADGYSAGSAIPRGGYITSSAATAFLQAAPVTLTPSTGVHMTNFYPGASTAETGNYGSAVRNSTYVGPLSTSRTDLEYPYTYRAVQTTNADYFSGTRSTAIPVRSATIVPLTIAGSATCTSTTTSNQFGLPQYCTEYRVNAGASVTFTVPFVLGARTTTTNCSSGDCGAVTWTQTSSSAAPAVQIQRSKDPNAAVWTTVTSVPVGGSVTTTAPADAGDIMYRAIYPGGVYSDVGILGYNITYKWVYAYISPTLALTAPTVGRPNEPITLTANLAGADSPEGLFASFEQRRSGTSTWLTATPNAVVRFDAAGTASAQFTPWDSGPYEFRVRMPGGGWNNPVTSNIIYTVFSGTAGFTNAATTSVVAPNATPTLTTRLAAYSGGSISSYLDGRAVSLQYLNNDSWTTVGSTTTAGGGYASIAASVPADRVFRFYFAGDGATYDAAASNHFTYKVKTTPTITVAASPANVPGGGTTTLTTTFVSPDPDYTGNSSLVWEYSLDGSTGWTQFANGSGDADGVYENTTNIPATRWIRARSLETTWHVAATSNKIQVTTTKLTTTATLTASDTSVTSGELFTLTAAVGPAAAGRTVTFQVSTDGTNWSNAGSGTTDASGNASITTSRTSNARYRVQVTETATYAAATSSAVQIYVEAATSLTLTVPPTARPGSTITVTGVLASTATAAGLTVYLERVLNGTGTMVAMSTTATNGSVSFTTTMTETTTYRLRFAGDAQRSAATSSEQTTTGSSALTLTAPRNVESGANFAITGTLDAGTQSVGRSVALQTFTNNAWSTVATGTTTTGGQVTFTRTLTTATSYRLIFAGVAEVAGSTSTTVVVAPLGLTLTGASNVNVGDSVTLTATLAGGSGRTVTLQRFDGTAWVTVATVAANTNGVATFAVAPTATTTYRASFAGDSELAAQTSKSLQVAVTKRTTALALTGPTTGRGTLTYTATLTSTGTGVVGKYLVVQRLTDTGWVGVATGTSDASGVVSANVSMTASASLRAVFEGDDSYEAVTSATLAVTVPAADTTLVITGPQTAGSGTQSTLTVTLANTAGVSVIGKTVTLQYLNGVTWTTVTTATTATGGVARFTVAPTATTAYRATFAGDDTLAASQSLAYSITVDRGTVLTVTAPTTPVVAGTAVSLNLRLVTAANVVLGGREVSVEENRNGTWVEVASSVTAAAGTVAIAVTPSSNLAGATYRAVFAGDATYDGATSATVAITLQRLTLITLAGATAGAPGAVLSYTATLTDEFLNPIANKPVVLERSTDGTSWTTVATAAATAANGTATMTYTLTANTQLRARFAGDGTYRAAVSAPRSVTVDNSPVISIDGPTYIIGGTSASITATFTQGGAPIAGKTVRIYYKAGTATSFTAGTTKTTDSRGVAVFSQVPVADTVFKVLFAGDASVAATASTTLPVYLLRYGTVLNLTASDTDITGGEQVEFTAVLTDAFGRPVPGRRINYKYQFGSTVWNVGGTATTDATGTARFVTAPIGTSMWRADFAGEKALYPATSGRVQVAVDQAESFVALTGTATVAAGTNATFVAVVDNSGANSGHRVDLEMYSAGTWRVVANGLTDAAGMATITYKPADSAPFRASIAASPLIRPATSNTVNVTVDKQLADLTFTTGVTATAADGTVSVLAGGTVTFTGQLNGANANPLALKKVALQRFDAATNAWVLVTTYTSTSTGAVSGSFKPAVTTTWRLSYAGDALNGATTSATISVKVIPATTTITGTFASTVVTAGTTTSVLVALSGASTVNSKTVALQFSNDGGITWTTVKTGITGSVTANTAKVTISSVLPGTGLYRVFFAGTTTLSSATSEPLTVTVVKVPATLSLTANDTDFTAAANVTFTATLASAGQVVTSKSIALQVLRDGEWTTVATALTGTGGIARATVAVAATGTYRAVYAGDVKIDTATSDVVTVNIG